MTNNKLNNRRRGGKAYTMVEVLAVIIIIGIILVTIFPLITNAVIRSKYRYYESQEHTLLLAGRDYFTADRNRLPKVNEEEKAISLKTLVDEGYTKPILDVNKDACYHDETLVTVKRLDKSDYRYYVRLVCRAYDTEYEVATVYNYQTPTIIKGEWGPWEDVVDSNNNRIIPVTKEGEVVQLEPEVKYQTVYQYRDQSWKWYRGEAETSACSSSSPGEGWIKSTECQWNYSHTACATSTPGTGYVKGSECEWNWSHTSGCQANAPGTGYSKLSECYWTYTRPECYSSCAWISNWTKNNTAVPGGYTSCTSRPIYLAKRCCYNYIYSGDYRNSVLVCCKEGVWKTYKETLTNCSSTADYCTSTWTTAYQYQCKAPTYSTCAASTPSGINWSKGSACRWTWTRIVCQASTPGTGYIKGTACYWNWTKTACATSSPGTGYVQGHACSWIWMRNAVEYADGYHITAPDGYPYKDSDQSIYTDWSAWSTTKPVEETYRFINDKEQQSFRPVTATWQGNRLTHYMTYDDINNYFQETYGKTFSDIETDPLFYLVSATMYRYKVKVY
ncbi:MAG: hypothetical protein WC267_03275 [Bacilli bacterium]